MTYRKNKEQILAAIIARLKTLPAGTSKCSGGLFREVFPDEPLPEFNDLFDLNYALHDLAEKEGLYLDGTHHFNKEEGLPFNLDFIVKPLKPVVSFDSVKYSESCWPSLPEELSIDLCNKSISYLPSDSVDREHPAIHKCTAPEWDVIADFVAGCRFDQWEESYIEPVLDGTSWKIDLLRGGKVVKKSSGSNGYPNCWEIFLWLKESCCNTTIYESMKTNLGGDDGR